MQHRPASKTNLVDSRRKKNAQLILNTWSTKTFCETINNSDPSPHTAV